MPIDFFISPCLKVDGNCKKEGIVCKKTTNVRRFGVSDANSNNRLPAFIDTENEEVWDLIVENPSLKEITFKAVDYCVDIFRDNLTVANQEQLIKRCEGFLNYDDKIVFLEIKNRGTGRWLIDAREKFQETITKFKETYPENRFSIEKPIVANKKFVRTHQNEMVQRRILKNAIGIDFVVSNILSIA